MSKPRYWCWGSIQNALRAYPRLKQQYEAPNVTVTARYSWKTIEEAAYEVGYSTQRAKKIHGEFIRLVAYHRRLIPQENVHKKRMSYQTAKKV